MVSPDGQTIAYIQYDPGRKQGEIGKIILVDADGSKPRALATIRNFGLGRVFGEYHIRDLTWSPDGKWLAFTSDYTGGFQIYLISADGSEFKRAVDFPGEAVYPQWRPGLSP